MKKSKDVLQPMRLILTIGVAILIVCIAVSFFHVFDIKGVYEKQAIENIQVLVNVATKSVKDEANAIKVGCTEMGRYVADTNYDKETLKSMNDVAEKYPGYSFAYIAENNSLFCENNSLARVAFGEYREFSKISGSYFNNNYMCKFTTVNGPKGVEHVALMGIYRLKRNVGSQFSYIVAVKDINDIVEKNSYDYIENMAAACIIDTSGSIVSQSERFTELIGDNQKNVFDGLVNISNGHPLERNKIKEVGLKIGTGDDEDFYVKRPDGSEIYCCYSKIEGAKGFYYFVCFDDSIIEDAVAKGAVRSFLACLFLIMVLVGVSIGVWTYMRSSSSLIEKLAFMDEVTGGWNFNYFKVKSAEIISDNREAHFVMCRFDIMNFRYINEAYGHKKADDVLKACILEFKKNFSNKEICVRVNSDQFISLVLNDVDMNSRIQRYNKAVGDRAKEAGVKYPIRFKSGFYQIKKEDRDIDVMIDHANAARKAIKTENKVMEAYYSDSIISDMKKVDLIESEMQVSLGKEEFRVFLQPKWDIVNDCVVGAEALVRWIKNDGTVIYPNDFIPVFEQNGFIEKLDFYMLEKVCAKLQELKKLGGYKMVPISINQSRILINNPDYVKSVEHVMERYEIDINNIELEITETVFFDEKDKMIEVVNQLKELGLFLSMDDFGSGYSSLNILKDIPFDVMKIDKEFFNEATTSQVSVIIMKKIIEMSEALNIEVICEGVETAEQVDMLRKIGCKKVQGYFYGKPMPAEEFIEKYLKEK